MIITKPGAEFLYKGETYRIGDNIVATTWSSTYAGLIGKICEIRTGKDNISPTSTPEIFCRFEIPKLSADIKEFEERISNICNTEKKIEDISLDSVVVSPEMITCPDDENTKERIFILTEEWQSDGNSGVNVKAFTDFHVAKAFLNATLAREMSDGLIAKWKDSYNFKFEEDMFDYEAWIDGYYPEHHYSLKIKEQEITVSPDFAKRIGKRYLDKRRYEDFYSFVRRWEEVEKLNGDEWQHFFSDFRIPREISKELTEKHHDEYWSVVYDVAHKLLNEYLIKRSEGQK